MLFLVISSLRQRAMHLFLPIPDDPAVRTTLSFPHSQLSQRMLDGCTSRFCKTLKLGLLKFDIVAN